MESDPAAAAEAVMDAASDGGAGGRRQGPLGSSMPELEMRDRFIRVWSPAGSDGSSPPTSGPPSPTGSATRTPLSVIGGTAAQAPDRDAESTRKRRPSYVAAPLPTLYDRRATADAQHLSRQNRARLRGYHLRRTVVRRASALHAWLMHWWIYRALLAFLNSISVALFWVSFLLFHSLKVFWRLSRFAARRGWGWIQRRGHTATVVTVVVLVALLPALHELNSFRLQATGQLKSVRLHAESPPWVRNASRRATPAAQVDRLHASQTPVPASPYPLAGAPQETPPTTTTRADSSKWRFGLDPEEARRRREARKSRSYFFPKAEPSPPAAAVPGRGPAHAQVEAAPATRFLNVSGPLAASSPHAHAIWRHDRLMDLRLGLPLPAALLDPSRGSLGALLRLIDIDVAAAARGWPRLGRQQGSRSGATGALSHAVVDARVAADIL
eukprot:CAMPEP_0196775404 /NCGR_PEP_ID=MMETSP1104-20130614/4007_1 /TAXON_ID=33652 /ORGANISM="Cafeteria sp., Strain Caron Lab Isolate" /LENGTH=440 /DNA_ID=CAMNT_0042145569 /DNA_START=62 /DNA_END=1381 /DNA_ORIENTATION=+